MKSQYRVVVIGGGVVGSSVLYHLAKFGWTDVCLIERKVLTAGSSWPTVPTTSCTGTTPTTNS